MQRSCPKKCTLNRKKKIESFLVLLYHFHLTKSFVVFTLFETFYVLNFQQIEIIFHINVLKKKGNYSYMMVIIQ